MQLSVTGHRARLTRCACWMTVDACAVQGSRPLPPQTHLLTTKRLPHGKITLRLAHLYQTGDQRSGEDGTVRARGFRNRVASSAVHDVEMLRVSVFRWSAFPMHPKPYA